MENDDDDKSTALLLVTANVGSLFEDPTRLLKQWLKEFLGKVKDVQPQFLALHLQEVGGKTYEKSMEYVQEFITSLCEAKEMVDFSFIRIYMDEDFNSAEHFTALGNLYFVHKSLEKVKIWNFLLHDWELAEDKNIYSGNIETVSTKEKSKFPQHFFPECKWSRKGFMRTRWDINNTVIDLVNIHLFHDASNLAACEEFPSVYCKTRRRALVHTLERFHLDHKNGLAPYFLFGDFNFRCDTEGVIKELTENLTTHRVQSSKSDSCTKVHYRNAVGDNVLTVGKKEFNHADHQLKFKESWLKKYDRELDALNDVLVEYPIDFPPSYPFEEDPEMPNDYMSTRCPSWCDRILMSPQAIEIINENKNENKDKENIIKPYSIIGENVCMGDHKPVYLNIRLKSNQGTYKCCKCNKRTANFCNNEFINKSSINISHHDNDDCSATTTTEGKIEIKNEIDMETEMKNDLNVFCPYNIEIFNTTLIECKNLTKTPPTPTTPLSIKEQINVFDRTKMDVNPKRYETVIDVENIELTNIDHRPPVSINIIDSDNIHVCMCSQITTKQQQQQQQKNDQLQESIEEVFSHQNPTTNVLKSYKKDDDDNVAVVDDDDDDDANNSILRPDGSICPECRKIIKKQSEEPRYRLISKRLLLSNNIIVNRIDTQYLNTYAYREEPYTPESTESHSPYPDSSNPNSTNSSKRFQSSRLVAIATGNRIQIEEESVPTASTDVDKTTKLLQQQQQQQHELLPGQLKSKLEDLQKSESQINLIRNMSIEEDAAAIATVGVPNVATTTTYTSITPNVVVVPMEKEQNIVKRTNDDMCIEIVAYVDDDDYVGDVDDICQVSKEPSNSRWHDNCYCC